MCVCVLELKRWPASRWSTTHSRSRTCNLWLLSPLYRWAIWVYNCIYCTCCIIGDCDLLQHHIFLYSFQYTMYIHIFIKHINYILYPQLELNQYLWSWPPLYRWAIWVSIDTYLCSYSEYHVILYTIWIL